MSQLLKKAWTTFHSVAGVVNQDPAVINFQTTFVPDLSQLLILTCLLIQLELSREGAKF